MKNVKQNNAHYGLITAISMIVGIVVGSGIFFKVDDVLRYTGGNISLGVLVFCIGAFGIIFGSLTLTELTSRSKQNTGIIGCYEEFISQKSAYGFGWFQAFVYYPALIATVSWVCGAYTCNILGIKNSLEYEIIIGFIYIIIFYIINILSTKLGGYFQNITTVIKLIPLLGIALISLVLRIPNASLTESVQTTTSNIGLGWLGAIVPVAFSFDGWVVATSISGEVKNAKKNMTLALIIGPIIVLGVYISYFLGLNKLLGPDYILSAGDTAVNVISESLFGSSGTFLMLILIAIAVMGVVNGLVLGSIRIPQTLEDKDMLPSADKISYINPRYQVSIRSALIAFFISGLWMIIHYISQKTSILSGDVSEIAIIYSYVMYITLYIRVIKMRIDKEIRSNFKGIICPVFAIIGSCIILIGGIISNPLSSLYIIIICIAVNLVGLSYYKYK